MGIRSLAAGGLVTLLALSPSKLRAQESPKDETTVQKPTLLSNPALATALGGKDIVDNPPFTPVSGALGALGPEGLKDSFVINSFSEYPDAQTASGGHDSAFLLINSGAKATEYEVFSYRGWDQKGPKFQSLLNDPNVCEAAADAVYTGYYLIGGKKFYVLKKNLYDPEATPSDKSCPQIEEVTQVAGQAALEVVEPASEGSDKARSLKKPAKPEQLDSTASGSILTPSVGPELRREDILPAANLGDNAGVRVQVALQPREDHPLVVGLRADAISTEDQLLALEGAGAFAGYKAQLPGLDLASLSFFESVTISGDFRWSFEPTATEVDLTGPSGGVDIALEVARWERTSVECNGVIRQDWIGALNLNVAGACRVAFDFHLSRRGQKVDTVLSLEQPVPTGPTEVLPEPEKRYHLEIDFKSYEAPSLSIGSRGKASPTEEAEHTRLTDEMKRLTGRSAWAGVDRAFEELMKLPVEPTVRDYYMGAVAARELGDTIAVYSRLSSAALVGDLPEVTSWLSEIEPVFGSVKIKAEEGSELIIPLQPFDPAQRRVIEVAQKAVREKGYYEGPLPGETDLFDGKYQLGGQEFRVKPLSEDKRTMVVTLKE